MAKKTLDYDEVLNYIGQFGTFQVIHIFLSLFLHFLCQKRIFFWLWLVSAGGGLAVMVFAFAGLSILLSHP